MNKKLLLSIVAGAGLALLGYIYFKPVSKGTTKVTAQAPATKISTEQKTTGNGKDEVPKDLKMSESEKAKSLQTIQYYTDLIQSGKEDGVNYYQRGLVYQKMQQYRLAVQDYTRALHIMPGSPNINYNRGLSYFADGMVEDAIRDFSEAIKQKSDAPRIYNSRGLAYATQKEFADAIADYNKAIELDPNYARAIYNRGNVYEEQKKYQEALNDYNAAIKLNTVDDEDSDPAASKRRLLEAYYRRASVYVQMKDAKAAMQDLNFIVQENPNVAKVYTLRAEVYRMLNEVGLANDDEAKAKSLEMEALFKN